MRQFEKIITRQGILFALAIICFLLIASSLSGIDLKSNSYFDSNSIQEIRSLLDQLGNLREFLAIVTILIFIAVFVFTFFRSSKSKTKQQPKKIIIPIYFYLFLWILLLVVFRRKVILNKLSLELPKQIQPSALFKNSVSQDPLHSFPDWLSFGLSFLFIITIVVIVGIIWKRSTIYAGVLKEISKYTQEAIEELQRGEEYTDVILNCYSQMCQVLYKYKGVKRSIHMTAREFEEHLIKMGFPSIAVHRLTALFEGARYGNIAANLEQQAQAAVCLREIREACEI